MFQGLIPNLFMGVYMAGLNQLCDIEIDKVCNALLINK